MPPVVGRLALAAAFVAVERTVHWIFDELQADDEERLG